MTTVQPIIAYYRVSTKRQGESGLGLEGQVAAAEAYARQVGGTIIAAYKEVESGKRSDRAELRKALAHAKRCGAVLVVAKLDRLSRNVAFLASILEAGTDFIACDNPKANRLTLHILAAVAEAELAAISDRTKAALAAYKRRGNKLGAARDDYMEKAWKGDEAARLKSLGKATKVAAKANKQLANDAYGDLADNLRTWKKEGKSLRDMAALLTELHHTTRRGKPWNAMQVSRVLVRLGI